MWVKGDIHCHTSASDGDSEPSAVCRICAEHGYDFLSITDHMRRVDPSQVDNPHGLLLIPGEELQARGEDVPAAPLHLNGIGVTKRLESEGDGVGRHVRVDAARIPPRRLTSGESWDTLRWVLAGQLKKRSSRYASV